MLFKSSDKEYSPNWSSSIKTFRGFVNDFPLAILSSTDSVLFSDSSDKISQFIQFVNKEKLNLLIIADLKGFDGGHVEMRKGILKFGSNIIGSLVKFNQKILIYIKGQLRGGTYVIFDSQINNKIRVICHPDSQIGIIQPAGLGEIKFKVK